MKTRSLLFLALAAASLARASQDLPHSANLLTSIAAERQQSVPAIFAVTPANAGRTQAASVELDLQPFAAELAGLCQQVCAAQTVVDFVPATLLRPATRLIKLIQGGVTLSDRTGGRVAFLIGRTGSITPSSRCATWTGRLAINW